MEGTGLIILAVTAVVALVPAAFIAYVNVGGTYRAIRSSFVTRKAEKREKNPSSQSCSIDADCPPGHVCVNGQCVPS